WKMAFDFPLLTLHFSFFACRPGAAAAGLLDSGTGAIAAGHGLSAGGTAAGGEAALALFAAVEAAVHGTAFAARRGRLQLRVLPDQKRLRIEHDVIAFLEALVHLDHFLVAAAELDLTQHRFAARVEHEALPLQTRADVA